MNHVLEQQLLQEIEQLKQQVNALEAKQESGVVVYQYSKIRDCDLEAVVEIERRLELSVFNDWFHADIQFSHLNVFFEALIRDNAPLIESYSEEDLKVNVLVPILNQVHFKSYQHEFRDFYELPLRYSTPEFIFNGTTDFVVSAGLIKSKKPYFFIQEFKRSEEYGNPRPQLLAELISAVELNQWQEIKGAYVIGANWYFVILKRLALHKYQYYVSEQFNSMRLDDLQLIYKHLLYIKQYVQAHI